MRILALSDEVAPQIYDERIKARFATVDLVLSCGDLPGYYLEYIVSMLNVPLFYVQGNHGYELQTCNTGRQRKGPEGCLDIHGRVAEYGGLFIAGLEGSMRYKEGPCQYTQAEMGYEVLRLMTKLLRHRLVQRRWLDILVTHAPPWGIHDGQDLCHTGFRAFLQFMRWCKPQYLLHGHSHVYNQLQTTTSRYRDTAVMSTHPYRLLEIDPPVTRKKVMQ